MINWKYRTALECANLVENHIDTMGKKDLREIIRTLMLAVNCEAAGEALLFAQENEELKAKCAELENKLNAALKHNACYIKAERIKMKRRILDALEEE